MAVFNDLSENKKLVIYSHKVKWLHHIPVASKAKGEVIAVEDKEPLKEACRHFLDCISNRTKPKTDAAEALAVLKVLEQAQQDLDRGEEK